VPHVGITLLTLTSLLSAVSGAGLECTQFLVHNVAMLMCASSITGRCAGIDRVEVMLHMTPQLPSHTTACAGP
jgi:hypothetical protein